VGTGAEFSTHSAEISGPRRIKRKPPLHPGIQPKGIGFTQFAAAPPGPMQTGSMLHLHADAIPENDASEEAIYAIENQIPDSIDLELEMEDAMLRGHTPPSEVPHIHVPRIHVAIDPDLLDPMAQHGRQDAFSEAGRLGFFCQEADTLLGSSTSIVPTPA